MEKSEHSESVLARVTQQLAALEKKDWELWLIVVVTGILLGAGFLAMCFPAAILKEGEVHFEVTVSRQLFLGLVALLILFNTYVINRRMELRRTREKVISTTLQSELVRLQSFTDPLTEVYNRRSLDEMVTRYISRARRLAKPLSFVMADVDSFKDVNTRFGHLTGDFILAEIATVLRMAVRGSDSVVRFGGDEFLMILADTGLDGAKLVISRITKFIEDWNHAGHVNQYEMSLSMGIAEWSQGMNLDQILSQADEKMYMTKAAQKGAF